MLCFALVFNLGISETCMADNVEPPQTNQSFQDCTECPEMVVLPSGSFNMGSTYSEHLPPDNSEGPVHRVTFANSFAIGKTEVTQAQWKAVMGNNPSGYLNCGDNCPVEQVSWEVVHDFINRLRAKSGKQYRLPSESEWEYACRAGKQQEYCGSDDANKVAWYVDDLISPHTQPVSTKQPNAWGIFDMSGNVGEWVEDSLHPLDNNSVPVFDSNGQYLNFHYFDAPNDGSVWQGGPDINGHVARGGALANKQAGVRAARRYAIPRNLAVKSIGFRLAVSIQDGHSISVSNKDALEEEVNHPKSTLCVDCSSPQLYDFSKLLADKSLWVPIPNNIASDSRTADQKILESGNTSEKEAFRQRLIATVAEGQKKYLDAVENEGASALHNAVKQDPPSVVASLLTQGADVNAKDAHSRTPLFYAITREMADLLISKGANITLRDKYNGSILQFAALKGHKEIVDLLISKGADINDQNNTLGASPLSLAISEDNFDVAELLIANGADVNTSFKGGKYSRLSPLGVAVMNGKLKLVKLLVSNGANVNAKTIGGDELLNTATSRHYAEIAELLISRGADVNAENNYGITPLMYASGDGQLEISNQLIAKGANVQAKAKNGYTPLHFASTIELAQLLISKGASINAADNDGRTPLSYAIEYKRDAVAEVLKQHSGK